MVAKTNVGADEKHNFTNSGLNDEFMLDIYLCNFCVSCSYVFLFRVSCILYDCMQDTTENQQYSAK